MYGSFLDVSRAQTTLQMHDSRAAAKSMHYPLHMSNLLFHWK